MPGMTPRENFWKAVRHEEPERVPIFWGGTNSSIVPGHYNAICEALDIVPTVRPVGDFGTVNLQAEIKERFHSDVDLVMLGAPPRRRMSGGIIQDGMWGFRMKEVGGYRVFPDDLAPLRKARSIDDIENHPVWPDPDDPAYYSGRKKQAQAIYDTGKVVLGEASYAGAPFFVYPWLRGFEHWMRDPYEAPDLYDYLSAKVVDASERILERWLEEVGAYLDVLCFYDDLGMQTGPMISLKHYRKWILPYEKRLVDKARKLTRAKICIHCCGSCYELLPGFLETGYDILNPVQTQARHMEAHRLKRDYGDRLCFYGGLDIQRLLPFGTVDDVRRGVKDLIRTLGPGGGFLFAASHNIQFDTPPENIVAMFDAAREYGQYPLSSL
jgi:uroporphyrinogen decarboxylase